jgi:hypothetical protein
MKIIIYLASQDHAAESNYYDLIAARTKPSQKNDVSFSVIEVRQEILAPSPGFPDLFKGVSTTERNVVVEFVAHGDPNYSFDIMSYKPNRYKKQNNLIEVPDPSKEKLDHPFDSITTDMLVRFFKDYGFDAQNDRYKFDRLTLYCCTSDKFALELSSKMPFILITAYQEPIFIDDVGNARYIEGLAANGTPTADQIKNARLSVPQKFHKGMNITNDPEFKFEGQPEKKSIAKKDSFSFGDFNSLLGSTASSSSQSQAIPSTTPTPISSGVSASNIHQAPATNLPLKKISTTQATTNNEAEKPTDLRRRKM